MCVDSVSTTQLIEAILSNQEIQLGPDGVPVGYLRIRSVADMYGVRIRTIYNRTYQGKLASLRVGSAVFIREEGMAESLADVKPNLAARYRRGPRK